MFDGATGRQIFTWMDGMVDDGLATTNADLGPSVFDDLLGIRSGSHAMAFDTSAALGTIKAVLGAGDDPEHRPRGGAAARARRVEHGGVFNQGGELFMVNKSAPAKQAAAWKFLKFLAEPENVTAWAIAHRLHPDPGIVGREHRDAGLLGAEPGIQGRLRPVAQRPGHRRHARARSSATTRECATRCVTR